ncbi:MAG: acyltransferase domain-containing protein, partial [bacterium]|nr:acyltransferase domain-containing protein [bacterium]
IPPTLHFAEPNPKIGFESTPFRVNAELVDWPADDDGAPRRAGVNVFGIGGTNAHAILEEAPPPEPSGESRRWQLLVLSARSTTALHRATDNLSDYLRRHPEAELADVAYTLQVGRKGFPIRRAVVCRDAGDALDALRTLDPQRVWTGAHDDPRPVAFLFPGEGIDPTPLASELYALESVFREQIDRCLELTESAVGEKLREALCPPAAAELDWDRPSAVTQAGLFAVEYALARLWMSWGVRPQAMLGDGVGELVAACLAGVFSLQDALALVAGKLAAAALGADSLSPPRIPTLSSRTGSWITPQQATDPDTWGRHRHATPRIDEALGQLFSEAESLLLEVGPGEMMSSRVECHPDYGFEQPLVRSIPPDSGPVPAALAAALASLWTAGAEVDWHGCSRGERRRRLILPTYPFERERYWIEGDRAAASPRQPAEKKDVAVADWFYAPSWKRSPDPVPTAALCRWLLLGRGEGISPPLIRHLRERGHEVVLAEVGERFERRSQGSYSIRPREEEDYEALLAELDSDGGVPEKIFHCWGLGVSPDGSDDLPAVSLFHLSRALGRLELSEPVTLGVVTTGLQAVTGDEAFDVDKATLLGLCKVLPRELEKLTCCSIDVSPPAPRSRNEAQLVERLVAELGSGAADERVAYRGNRRWVHGWEPFRPPLPEAAAECLRRQGVILFLHGLEGPGAGLAETLVRDFQTRLVAVEPPGFPAAEDWDGWLETRGDDDPASRKIHRFRTLEEEGAELLVAAADPGQRRRLAAARDAALERFGALDGVVYCVDPAAAAWSQDVLDTDLEVWENLIRSHARALVVLEEILDGQAASFCLVVSELSMALGGAGAAVGAAIGSFIDLFVEQHNQTSPVPWVHLNVDAGRDITPEEDRELWRRILATRGLSQILIAPGGLTRRAAPPQPAGSTRHRRPDLRQEYVAPRNPLEELVAGIWEEVLGIETIGIHDDLFELGGNSLLATQLVSRVRDLFGVELSLREMNELRTPAELTAALERHGIDQAAAEEVVELMNALEGMSDEEAERLAGDEVELD